MVLQKWKRFAVAVGTLRTVTEEMQATTTNPNVVDRHPLAYDLSGTRISGYSLSHLKADHGYLVRTDLSYSDLSSSQIGCTNLTQANLHNVDLRGAVVDSVRVDRADLSGIVIDKHTQLGKFYWDEPPVAFPAGVDIQQAGTGDDFASICS